MGSIHRTMVVALAATAVMVGCQAAPPGASVDGAAMAGRVGVGSDAWPAAPLAIEQAGDRHTLGTGSASWNDWWAGGNRHTTGRVSNTWGGAPLGYGYRRGGLLPFYWGGLGAAYGLNIYDAAANTVYAIPALDDAAVAAVGGGGRFITYVDAAGRLGVYDMQTQLIQTFPQLDYSYPAYAFGLLNAGIRRRGVYGGAASVDAFGNVAYVGPDAQLRLFDSNTGQEYIVPGATRGLLAVDGLVLSADGGTALVSGGSDAYLLDLRHGRQLTVPFIGDAAYGPVQVLDMSGDGTRLLYSDGGRLRLLDQTSGFIDNLALLYNYYAGPVYDATFLDPAGELIAFERNGQMQVFDRRTGLIDTMPIANRARAAIATSLFNYGPLY